MGLSKTELSLLVLFLFVVAVLYGCTEANFDTNGYHSRLPSEHPRYCQVTRGKVISFVPCDEVKHDITI